MVLWLQNSSFFPFLVHLSPSGVTRILSENGKAGKGFIAFNQFVQMTNSSVIKLFR